ncbi:hscarg dehydrogenase [Aspergillus californicus]
MKTITIVGATGQQGRSVVQAILNDPSLSKEYTIRGTTRDISKPQALKLSQKGVEMVSADLNDPASLRRAFTGAEVVFANSITIYDEHTFSHEVNHGRAMADAAVAVGVPFYIYSTLPHAGNNSNGRLKHMGHFDGKAEVEAYIRTLPIRSAFVSPGSFMSNFHDNTAPRSVGDGVFALATPIAAETRIPLIDTLGDMGKWVAAILVDFEAFEGKVLACATGLYSYQEIVDTMSRVSGRTVVYSQVPEEVWKGFLPPIMRDHIADMLRYFQDYGYYGEGTEEKVQWSARQARGDLTTLEEYLVAHPLQLE